MRLLQTKVNEILGRTDILWAPDYIEPGYSAGPEGVYFADWNPKKFARDGKPGVPSVESRLAPVLEHLGAEIEWSDEWDICPECNRAVRTQADHYGWKPSYVILNECELVCRECILEDPDGYLEHLTDDPTRADTFGVDLAEHGFHKRGEYETGLHPGQADDPANVFDRLTASGVAVVFQIDSVGQFDARWSAWTKEV